MFIKINQGGEFLEINSYGILFVGREFRGYASYDPKEPNVTVKIKNTEFDLKKYEKADSINVNPLSIDTQKNEVAKFEAEKVAKANHFNGIGTKIDILV